MSTEMTLEQQIEEAFAFRGHVTIKMKDSEIIEGHIFNRVLGGEKIREESFIAVFPKGQDGARHLPYSTIESVSLTGEDSASGNSYEGYLKRKREREEGL